MKVTIKGVIVPNDDLEIYDWFGIEATSPGKVSEQISQANGEPLEVEINSPGGDVFSGSEIYTALKSYAGTVTTRIVGVAASAASVAAMGGHSVMISPTAQIMIHNATNWSHGDHRDHQQSADMIKSTNKSIANAYILKTGLPEADVLAMMDSETWLNAQKAVEMGFADEIMFEDKSNPRLVASAVSSQLLPLEVIERMRNEIRKAPKTTNQAPAPQSAEGDDDNVKDLQELQAKHPEIYNAAVAQGRQEERSRITDLNALAGAPGAADIVAKAITEGRTAAQAAVEIVQASMQRLANEGSARAADSQASNAAIVPAEGPTPQATAEASAQAEADAIAAEMKKLRGGN